MKLLNLPRLLTMTATAALLTLGAAQSQAQDRGRPDPEQFRTRMMERFREQLNVSGDDEWKVIETRLDAVLTARRDLGALTPRGGGFGGFAGRGRGGEGGQGRGRGGQDGNAGRGGEGRRGGPPGFGGEPSPQVEALEKAVESKASADVIKSKLADLRAARKDQEAKVAKAQDGLRQVLSLNQEASAVLMGLLE